MRCRVTMTLFPDWLNVAVRPSECPLEELTNGLYNDINYKAYIIVFVARKVVYEKLYHSSSS